MTRDSDVKGKVIELLTGAEAPRTQKGRRKKKPRIQVSGRGNVVGVGEHVHIKHQVIERPTIQPAADAITPGQARQVQNAVERLVDIDQAAGVLGGERSKLFAKWYRAIKDRYEVPSYRTIPAHQADELLAWLARTEAVEQEHLGAAGLARLAEIRAGRG